MHVMKKLMSLICVCTKAQCPCKALDIRHYVCLPNEGFVPNEASKTNSSLSIYQKLPTQVVKPHSMHVKLVGSKINSYHQIPKKIFTDKTTQSTPRCILTPRCLSCKKIQRKIIKFNKRRNKKHKKYHFLKRKRKFYSIKQKNYAPNRCLQHSNSIQSSSQRSLGHIVQWNEPIIPLHANQNNVQPKINKLNGISSNEEYSRGEEECGWCNHKRKLHIENNKRNSPLLFGYDNSFCLDTINSSSTNSSKLLENNIYNSRKGTLQPIAKISKINQKKVEIKNLPPPHDLLNYSKGTVYISETSNVPVCNLFLPSKSCHCHKVDTSKTPCQKDTFCKFCPCHKNVHNLESTHCNPKLQPKTTIEQSKIYCSSQIVGLCDLSSTNSKEKDQTPLEYNFINKIKNSDVVKDDIHLKDKNIDDIFKKNLCNDSKTPISSCSMASTSSFSRTRSPSPVIELKSSECKNKFLKQSPPPSIHGDDIQCPPSKSIDKLNDDIFKQSTLSSNQIKNINYPIPKAINSTPNKFLKQPDSPVMNFEDTQSCTTPKFVDNTPTIGNSRNCHEDNEYKFPTKCNVVTPIEQFKCSTPTLNLASEISQRSSKCGNHSFEIPLLPIHAKAENCPSLECSYPSPKCAACDCHNDIQNQVSTPTIPLACQSNITKSVSPSYSISIPNFLCKTTGSTPPVSSYSWNTSYDSTCEYGSLPLNSCQRFSPPISSCGTSSLPISSCKTRSLFFSPKVSSSLQRSQDLSSKPPKKIPPCKHTHSPKCAKNELQDPPCPSQQQQLQYENYGASNQNYITNTKPMYPPSSPSSLCQPMDTSDSNESKFSNKPQFSSLGEHNCCCGKCKPSCEYSQMKNKRRCFHCGHFHSCCCGMCHCPNPNCPKSPYGHSSSQPISFSRQELAFKRQQKLPTRLMKLTSTSPTKKEFKDHYKNCCILQDSRSRGRSYPHNIRDDGDLSISQQNSTAQNYVLQPLSMYKSRPSNPKKHNVKQSCLPRAQWSSTMWSPMKVSYNCCCQRCLKGEACTIKKKI